MNTQLELLAARLEQTETELRARIDIVEARSRRERRKLRIQSGLAFTAFLAAVFASPGNRAAIAQGAGATLADLDARLSAVEAKTQYMSVDTTAKTTTFTACNVQIQNGLGATNGNPADPYDARSATVNGVGNLIIGYNANQIPAYGQPNIRTGSHNLIVGDIQNYSSYGGVLSGLANTANGPYSFISGSGNKTNGGSTSITGGAFNTANGDASSISGGTNNTTNGQYSSVAGGALNNAYGYSASIGGGVFNNASGQYSSIAGGYYNAASNYCSSVSGGMGNTASGYGSSVSGGNGVAAIRTYGWAAGYTGSGAYHNP